MRDQLIFLPAWHLLFSTRRILSQREEGISDALDSLGNCSNRRNYDYSDTDVKKIFSEIEKKVKETRSMFQATAEEKKLRLY